MKSARARAAQASPPAPSVAAEPPVEPTRGSECLESRGEDLWVRVHVKPRARREGLVGVRGAALEVAVRAPPVEGAANAAVEALLAATFGCARGAVQVVQGQTSREKRVRVSDMTLAEARVALAAAPWVA